MSIGFLLNSQLGKFEQGEHDVVIDNVGQMIQLTGSNKLFADLFKLFFTSHNPLWAEFSSDLYSFIGTTAKLQTTKRLLAEAVTNNLVEYQNLQKQQLRYQPIDGGELLKAIKTVNVEYLGDSPNSNDPNDAFTFKITVVVVNALDEPITVAKALNLQG